MEIVAVVFTAKIKLLKWPIYWFVQLQRLVVCHTGWYGYMHDDANGQTLGSKLLA